MPSKRFPKYSLHKASGQARVCIDGRDQYLGPYESPESRTRYRELIDKWQLRQSSPSQFRMTVGQMIILADCHDIPALSARVLATESTGTHSTPKRRSSTATESTSRVTLREVVVNLSHFDGIAHAQPAKSHAAFRSNAFTNPPTYDFTSTSSMLSFATSSGSSLTGGR
ncbi:MAG: hypothetical protein P8M30_00510 [Planctomycetaceae bacterium]|nr:hypothetical protein [Planctomycetaceae bacterium]MDG2387775.1 hypothetical protein [Planctomycetaceae bacterium]